jgi:hypothetical protein
MDDCRPREISVLRMIEPPPQHDPPTKGTRDCRRVRLCLLYDLCEPRDIHRVRATEDLFRFFYAGEYDEQICQAFRRVRSRREIMDLFIGRATDQAFLRRAAQDLLASDDWPGFSYKPQMTAMLRSLELDGYIFVCGRLLESEGGSPDAASAAATALGLTHDDRALALPGGRQRVYRNRTAFGPRGAPW